MNIKHTILLLLGLMLNTQVFSQNITDIFIGLPDSAVLGLTSTQRKVIVEKALNNLKTGKIDIGIPFNDGFEYGVDALDKKNGYFSMSRHGDEGGSELQVCYWNVANGDKLIAVCEEWISYTLQGAESLQFFLFNGKEYKLVNVYDVIPGISRKSDTLLADIESLFFDGNYQQIKNKMEDDGKITTNLRFILPQKGKNITVFLNSDDEEGPEHEKKTLKEYKVKGNKMELIWNNGKFAGGKVYWGKIAH